MNVGAPTKEDLSLVSARMDLIKHKILVLSGKGGVGKSTVSVQLALILSQIVNAKVGVLDIDLCGPSIPQLLGLKKKDVMQSTDGYVPVHVESNKNLCAMSIGFLLPNDTDPVIWRGPKKTAVIKQFLHQVVWGELDYLIVDTPPGTSDEHISIVQYLNQCNIDGAVIVTTPQAVSLVDVRREIDFCKKTGINILGLVENMSGYKCPCCDEVTNIFATGGGKALAEEMKIPFIGSIPIDTAISTSGEQGASFVEKNPSSSTLDPLKIFALSLTKTPNN